MVNLKMKIKLVLLRLHLFHNMGVVVVLLKVLMLGPEIRLFYLLFHNIIYNKQITRILNFLQNLNPLQELRLLIFVSPLFKIYNFKILWILQVTLLIKFIKKYLLKLIKFLKKSDLIKLVLLRKISKILFIKMHLISPMILFKIITT